MNELNNTTEFPEILEAEWDFEQVNTLFENLEEGAQVNHVQIRSDANDRSLNNEVSLEEAKTIFSLGKAKAIQIKYVFDGKNWCDTLMILPNSVRIIRTYDVTT